MISLDEQLRLKLEKTESFDDLANLAKEHGYTFSADQLKAHAETVVILKSQDLEEQAISQTDKSESGGSGGFQWNFFKRRARIDIWEHEMTRLCYYSPDPFYDAHLRLKEKGG